MWELTGWKMATGCLVKTKKTSIRKYSQLTNILLHPNCLLSTSGNHWMYLCKTFYDPLLLLFRNTVGQWIKAFLILVTIDVTFYALVHISQQFVSPISRRMANLSFVLWQVCFAGQCRLHNKMTAKTITLINNNKSTHEIHTNKITYISPIT